MALYGYKKKYASRTYFGPLAEKKKQLCEQNADTSNHSPAGKNGVAVKSFSSIRRTPIKRHFKPKPTNGTANQTSPKPRTWLRPFSKRRSIVSQLYNMLRGFYLAQNPMCCVKSDSSADDIHHCRGKNATLMLDWRFWKAVSRKVHNWIGDNPNEAREAGLLCAWGEWNTAPDDDRTRELKDIMLCAQNDLPEAKRMLTSLARSSGLLTDSPAPTK
jgi:hypothetical protein